MRFQSGPAGPGFERQHAARIDCEKNGCNPKHADDGEIVFRNEYVSAINGHAVTMLRRTITYSAWEEVDACPDCGHGWDHHERQIDIPKQTTAECDANTGMGDWCGCKKEKPWSRRAR